MFQRVKLFRTALSQGKMSGRQQKREANRDELACAAAQGADWGSRKPQEAGTPGTNLKG
jgi:hypothetical protein